jgi:hypothetical protein
LRCPDSDGKQGPRGFSPDFQICLPYRGLFVWHVGHDDVVGEANQILFVSGGEAFCVSRPARGGYGELIVTPMVELLGEMAHVHDLRQRVMHPRTHELLEYLDQQRAAGRATFERIPASSRSGPLSLYGWIAFAGAHEARHAQQIRECLSV